MIYDISKKTSLGQLRCFSVVPYECHKVLLIGGMNENGTPNYITVYDVETGTSSNLISKNHEKLARPNPMCLRQKNNVYIITCVEVKTTVLILNLETLKIREIVLDEVFSVNAICFSPTQEQFIKYNGNVFLYYNINFDKVKEVQLTNQLGHTVHTKFKGVIYKDWFYLFGGFSGISFQKRFFRFHVKTHVIEYLNSIPNTHNTRFTGLEMILFGDRIFFIMNMFSLSRHNFFYVYNIKGKEWENHYILKYSNKHDIVNIYKDSPLKIGLKSGIRSYGSFLYKKSIFVFATDELFHNYPNSIFRISIPTDTTSVPLVRLNDPRLSDFQIMVCGNVFYCHRHVLSRFSHYFHTMFYSDYVECSSYEVDISLQDSSCIRWIFEYMYQYPFFDMTTVDWEKIDELLTLVDYFQIQTMLHDIETFIIYNFSSVQKKIFSENQHQYSFPRLFLLSRDKIKKE